MAELSYKYWNGESLRMTLYIDEEQEYVSYMNSTSSERFISSISFNKAEGNSAVNPLGIVSSDSINVSLFDINDDLSPASLTSPYAGKIVTGLKVKLEITYNMGQTWEPYGIYYTTGFSGGYSNGMYTAVSMQAEDRLNALGNMILPVLDVYANAYAGDILTELFKELGFTEDDYYIDPKLDTNILWGTSPNTKVRDFINGVCQRIFARVIIDSQGVIKFVPALEFASNYNSLTVNANDLGTLKNNNASNINYSKVNVSYYVYERYRDITLYKDDKLALAVGSNTLNNIVFDESIICIKNVDILYKSELGLGRVSNVNYTAYENGMILNCEVSGSNIYGVVLKIEGIAVSKLTSQASVNMDTSNRIGLTEYTFNAKARMTKPEALELANKLVGYIKTLQNTVRVTGTVLTPRLTTGDKLIIEDTDTMYDGTYKVIKQTLNFGEDYKNDMTLLRIDNND